MEESERIISNFAPINLPGSVQMVGRTQNTGRLEPVEPYVKNKRGLRSKKVKKKNLISARHSLKEDVNEQMETQKKLKREKKSKNDTTSLGPLRAYSPEIGIKLEREAVSESILENATVISVTSGIHDGINQVGCAAEMDVNCGSVVRDLESHCANLIDAQKANFPCSKNARRKRVKPLKNDQDDQTSQADTSTNKKSKKKNSKASCSERLPVAVQEDDQTPGIDKVHTNKKSKKKTKKASSILSEAKKVSPYFQKKIDEKERKNRDDAYCKNSSKRSIDKTVLKEFEKLLSNYAYRDDSNMDKAGDNVDVDGVTEGLNSSSEKQKGKKQKRGITNGSLTRAEKFIEAYQRKSPNNMWKPPRSPFELLQEDHAHDPWRVLVICMLLNITTGPQVRRILGLFFQLCPTAEAAVHTQVMEIARVIQSLGLQNKRAAMIQRFSEEYLSDSWTHVTQLHGIGKYAADAYAIFCNGAWDQVTPNDHKLNYYWKFLQKRAQRAREMWNS